MYLPEVSDPTDRATILRDAKEQCAVNNSRPTKKLFVLAQFKKNGSARVWHETSTRPASLLKLGIPAEATDPPYALAHQSDGRGWIYDQNSHPQLQEAVEKYITDKIPPR